MKKIVMLLDNTFESDFRVEKEAKSLYEAGFKILIIALRSENLPFEEDLGYCKVKRILDPIFKSPFRMGYKRYLEDLSKEISAMNFDVIHCHDYHMLTIGAMVKMKNQKLKLIYDSHEFLSGWPIYKASKGWLNKLKGYLVWRKNVLQERKYVQKADHVITVSSSMSEALFQSLNLPTIPTVAQNIPHPFNHLDERYFHNFFGLPKKTKVMLQVGNIYQENDQLISLFEIIMDIKDLVLVVIGNKPRYFEIKKLVENSRYSKKILFHEYLDQPQLYPIISTADIGLVHMRTKWDSHKFASPNRFMEYSMAGLAIISTKIDICMELGNKYGHAIFYDETDIVKLKHNIVHSINNLDDLKNNSRNFRAELNWEVESKKLLQVYSF